MKEPNSNNHIMYKDDMNITKKIVERPLNIKTKI
jgi:hypothetical protein